MSAAEPIHQGEPPARTVTPGRRPGLSAAERKRQQRERDRGTLLFERPDWRLFLDVTTLPQKAGCQPGNLRAIALREVVDNALDAGAETVTLDADVDDEFHGARGYIIADDGPGLAPADVPRLFAVNRPLLSSKRKRLPLRGMLGNGLRVVMGAVAASEGSLIVETRGHRLTLAVDDATGITKVVEDVAIPAAAGLTVRLAFGPLLRASQHHRTESQMARNAIALATHGKPYSGASSPWWYSPRDFHMLASQVKPVETTVGRLCLELGFTLADSRPACSLSRDEAETVLDKLREGTEPVPPERLGTLGPDILGKSTPGYGRSFGFTSERGASIPYVVEVWAECRRAEKRGTGDAIFQRLIMNRTPSLAELLTSTHPGGVQIQGCGLYRRVRAKPGHYKITVSVISPYIELATDGKAPALAPFSEAIAEALQRACSAAHAAMDSPKQGMSIKTAARLAMPEAYASASGDGQYPANARQIMYAARPAMLALTGRTTLDDKYFTGTLLPDYIEAHPDITADWDVVFDARGHFVEPHTDHEVALGTLAVREYLGLRATPGAGSAIKVDPGLMWPTHGPVTRFSAVLFVEKEGFAPLFAQAHIAERFDIAIMSTKGMSVTAARLLLDQLAPKLEKVLVLHDFDVAGFSIFGTLGTDGRRYIFENYIPIVDIGLRLDDVEAMNLTPEPVETTGDWDKRADTLAEHGATYAEIEFLEHQRVELNAMTAPVFVAFLEQQLTAHGIRKVVPNDAVLLAHARRVMVRELTNRKLHELQEATEAEAAALALPDDLRALIEAELKRQPGIPWDSAIAALAREALSEGSPA